MEHVVSQSWPLSGCSLLDGMDNRMGGAGRTNKSENCECAIGCNWYDYIFVLWVGDDLFFVGCLVVASRLRNWQHFGMMFGDSTWRDGDIANKLSSVFG